MWIYIFKNYTVSFCRLILDHKGGFKYQENMVAITDHGSELYEFAIENNFMEISQACEDFIANPLIEEYEIEISENKQ